MLDVSLGRRLRLRRPWLALLAALVAAGVAHAQPGNLVSGPDFDSASDLTNNWGNLGSGKAWSSLDFEASATSGSVSINNTAPSAGTGSAVFTPCFPVDERHGCVFGLAVHAVAAAR